MTEVVQRQLTVKKRQEILGADRKVLYLDRGHDHTTENICQKPIEFCT